MPMMSARSRWLSLGLAVAVLVSPTAKGDDVSNSKHNMMRNIATSGGTMATYINQYGEVCVFCHTPHHSNATLDAPLWNRATPTEPFTMYSSPTMDSVMPSAPGDRSLACLSCHDGTIAVDAILNRPGPGLMTTNWYGYTPSAGHMAMRNSNGCGDCHAPGGVLYELVFPGFHNGSGAYLGTDLSDDHPVGMTYPTASVDAAFNTPPSASSGWNDVRLFLGRVECPSCHNPHDTTFPPFLRKANDGSRLCLTCHVK